MFYFRIYTYEAITFNLPETQFRSEFVNKKTTEFQSLLRSPHANKNAQEQFARVKYVYTIRFKSQRRAQLFYNQMKQTRVQFPAFIIIAEHETNFQTHF